MPESLELRTVVLTRYVTPLREGGSLPVAERFRWLTATRSTVVQCSPLHPGRTADAAATLERLFAELVS